MMIGGAMLLVLLVGANTAWAKRTRYFELQPMAGYSYVHLTGFSPDGFTASLSQQELAELDAEAALMDAQIPVKGYGPSAGLAAQLKLWVFIFGGRYTMTQTSDFALHTFGGDLGMRLGNRVSVYGRGGLGYSFVSGLPRELETEGLTVSISGGLEIKLGEPISIGLGADGDVLLLSQHLGSAANIAQGVGSSQDLANLEGSAVGFQLRPQLHLTWHM